MYTKVLILFAFTILIVNSQLITTKRIKSGIKNRIKVPKNLLLNLPTATSCNCPRDLPRIPQCPCGCSNPIECNGPIINSFGCSENPCKCGGCRTIGQCRCSDLPIIDSSYNFLPELLTGPSVNLPFPVIEVPFVYPLCGCNGPCQCISNAEPVCPINEPYYSPIITDSYITPDLSTYSVSNNVQFFEPSCLPCGCPGPTCNCQSINPIYEIFAPVQECPAPVQVSCGCSRQCGCVQNVKPRSISVIELPNFPVDAPKCSCGVPSCGIPSCGCAVPLPPLVGCSKYLRQVTIQPPFL